MRGTEFLTDLTLRVGTGSDHFAMSHGSFKYKRSQSKMRLLTRDGERFIDQKAGSVYRLHRECLDGERKGILHLWFTRESGLGTENRFDITIQALPDEHIYGCGETYSKLDLKGENVRIFVAEHQNAGRIGKKLIREKIFGVKPNYVMDFSKYESYYAQPTFVGAVPGSHKYFIHVNCKRYSEFDFRDGYTTTFHLEELPDLYYGEAETFQELSRLQSALLGRQQELPDWIYDGAILAIQEGCDRIDEKLARAKEAGIKVNGVWSQDWCGCRRTGFGYQVMWNWKADECPGGQYPDLAKHIEKWGADGIAFLGYINPFIALEKDIYQEAAAKGYCVKDKEGKDYLVTITTFPAAMVDFTNPEAYAWYKNLIKENMIGIGMKGWMADFGEYLPLDAVLFDGSDPMDRHNERPAIWAGMNREAIQECHKEGEVFFFTRAGSTKTIRNSMMMWTGDQHVDWSVDDGLPSVIPASLSLAMSGYGISHSDAGGYTTVMHMKRSKELLIRWEEMNAFSPLLRTHEGNQPVNDVQFDDDQDLLRNMNRAAHWHVLLKDYLQQLVRECKESGIPVMRPLFYHYDEAWCYTEKTEYLLGGELLIAPILEEGKRSRLVRLPDDHWIHLFTGERFQGGDLEIEASIEEIPVFVRDSEEGRKIVELFRK